MPFELSNVDAGATAWVLASAALVLLMTPGLAFFYGGMVRAKNVLGMLMQNFVTIGIVSVVWVLVSYSLAFGGDNAYLGGFHFAGLKNMAEIVPGYVDNSASGGANLAQVIPPIVFVGFQLMFAVITPALITGGTADRWKFPAFVTFVVIWSIVVYAPVAHWVFSPTGWLFKRGALDFAGGTVVHANAGIAALAVVLVLGKRRGWPKERFRPHNVPFVMLGCALLWFGWFGFNAGSALGANSLAGYAFVNTNTATAAALLAWILVEKIRDGKPTTLGAASGAVAGLVAITPAAGFVTPMGSVAIGLIAGTICCLCVGLKFRFKFDDSLDVVAVHLVGGISGALLIGFFADKSVNSLGADGVFNGGGWSQLGKQALAVGAVIGYSFIATLIIALVLNVVFRKMRMTDDAQLEGMDSVLHGETAYEFGPSLGSAVGTLTGTGAVPSSGGGSRAHPGIPASGSPMDEATVRDKTGVDA